MSIDIILTQAIFGMGNQNHEHVHRNNEFHIQPMGIDQLKMEQVAGGVLGTTLSSIAEVSGGISANPRGTVSVEGGWNQRRGIGLLRFQVSQNALESSELSVLGYLVGGGATVEGVMGETMFVPVRTYSSLTRNVPDLHGLPMAKTVVESSAQFLMGDPNQIKDLKSVRPMDFGNEALGYASMEAEGRSDYSGSISGDLSNNVSMSKTHNLNPTHFSKELIKLAISSSGTVDHGSLEMGIGDGLSDFGMSEAALSDNPFMMAMMYGTGHASMKGFMGYSVEEICNVFTTFPSVLNLTLLESSNFAEDNTLLTTQAYGTAGFAEIISTELAFVTVHLLITCGLASFCFTGTNNPTDFDGLMGDSDGVVIIPGAAMSVINHDPDTINKVERFMRELKTHFFKKYTSPYMHERTVINIEVNAFMFGETTVAIAFNGDMDSTKQYTNATYMINRTSINIAGTEMGLLQSKNYLDNIKSFLE